MRQSVEKIDSYKEKVKALLESMRLKHQNNPKMLRKIDHLIPLYDAHDFWDSQPVPKAYEAADAVTYDQAIDRPKTVDEVKKEPYTLPAGFRWVDVDIADPIQAQEVYELLT